MKKIIAMSMSLVMTTCIFTGCADEFGYLAYIWYIDSEAGEYQKTNGVWIAADTKDQYLQLDNIRIANTERSDPRDTPLSGGKAKIFVN